MLLGNLLQNTASRAPDKCALIFDERGWTYEEIDKLTDQIARSLLDSGIDRGDRVALFLQNCPELVFAYYACFKIGAIAVPLNNRYKGPELEYAVDHCQAKILIVQDALFPEFESVRTRLKSLTKCYLVGNNSPIHEISPFTELLGETQTDSPFPAVEEEDPAAILYTSGTTSKPKGVVHTHFSLAHTVLNQATTLQMDPSAISLVSLSICHIAGFAGQTLTAGYVGGTVVLLPKFDPEAFLEAVERYRPTMIMQLPATLEDLITHPKAATCDFSSLKCCIAGGDKVPLEVHRRFRELAGMEATEGCGMTESFSYALNPPFGKKRLGSIGLPVHATSLRLADDAGREVPQGEVGEILVRSDANMREYWNSPEETAKVLKEGWLYSGDLGRVDEAGYYWFVGRKKDIIIRGGSNISPLEVEDVLYKHPAVNAVCVVGQPDRHLGQRVKAYVSLKGDVAPLPTEGDLKAFAAARIAAYKVPEEIEFLPDLPLNPTGKVDRHKMEEWAAARH